MTNLAADKCITVYARPIVVLLEKSHLVDTLHHLLNKRGEKREWFYGAALVPTQNVVALHSVRDLIEFTEATQLSDGYSNYQPCNRSFPNTNSR